MAGNGPWPVEAEDALRKLWPSHTASQAAAIITRAGFQCSRNAVIGKAHRIGLAGKPRSTGNRIPWTEEAETLIRSEWGSCTMAELIAMLHDKCGIAPAESTLQAKAMRMGLVSLQQAQRGSRYFRIGRIGNRNKTPLPPKHVPEPPKPPVARMVSLMDLDADACRFPINDPRNADFGFCGAPKAGRTYCAFHHRLCYRPAEKRERAAYREFAAA